MKNKISAILTVGVVILIFSAGCKQSLQQTVEDAKGSAQREQQEIKDKAADAQFDYLDEWQEFRSDAEKQIVANTNKIDTLRTKVAAASDKERARLDASVEALALTNRRLQAKLNDYKDEGKIGWDVFKRDFTNEMHGLQGSLKDLAAKNK